MPAVILSRVLGAQPAPPWQIAYLAVCAGFVAVAMRSIWRWTRYVITLVHEAGHAVVALLTGHRVLGVHLNLDTSGSVRVGDSRTARTLSRTGHGGRVLIFISGYPAPSITGLLGAAMLALDRITLALVAVLALLPLLLLLIRNAFGVISVAATWGSVFAVAWFTPPLVQAAFAYTATWLLLFGGVRPVLEAYQRRRTGKRVVDVEVVAKLTRLPAFVCLAVLVLVTVTALAAGSWLLLHRVVAV